MPTWHVAQMIALTKCRKTCGTCGESLHSPSPSSIMSKYIEPSRHMSQQMSSSMSYTSSPTKGSGSRAPTSPGNPLKAPQNSARPHHQLVNSTMTDDNILYAAYKWIANNSAALASYGNIRYWDTSRVTNMVSVFGLPNFYGFEYMAWEWNANFNADLSLWDTSRVISMDKMFEFARSFKGEVSHWDTSQVTSTAATFLLASSFNGDLSHWDTSHVTNLESMFQYAGSFNGNLSHWNTSQVKNMDLLFANAESFNGNLAKWNTGQATSMYAMFAHAYAFNADLSDWNTSQVENMKSMFWYAISFNQVLCWDMSKVNFGHASMDSMFYGSGGSLSQSPYPSCHLAIRKSNGPIPPGYPSKAPLNTRLPTLSNTRKKVCKDSTTPFKWNNGLYVDCEWVANHGEITCGQMIARAKCPKSCGACGEALYSPSPSITSRFSEPSSMPQQISSPMSYSPSPANG